MLNHYKVHKKYYENGAYNFVKRIDSDPSSDSYGATKGNPAGYHNVAELYSYMLVNVVSYYLEGTTCYRDEIFLKTAKVSLDGAERYIHEDGTVDLRVTNFHDPTYCGFNVRDYIGPALELVRKYSKHTELENAVEAQLISVITRMGRAMETLGFHTPNHRWVISSALSYVKHLTGDEKAGETMDKYFWEGIDCDEYGEYTERSTGIYNLICNQSFLQLAHMEDIKFLEYPTRNMHLMRSFYEPNDMICTLNSMRQDRGSDVPVDNYYTIYLPLALYTGDPEFAYYSDRALKRIMAEEMKKETPFEYLHAMIMYWFLVNDEWRTDEKYESIASYLPKRDLSVYLPESGIARIYKDNVTMTILRTNAPDFFKLQSGKYTVCARCGGSFFGLPHSQFRPKKMEKTENGYRLISREEAGYRSQFDAPPETSVWRHMDHSKRELLNVQQFDTVVDVTPGDHEVDIDVDFSGADLIPTKLELTFTPGGRVSTDEMCFTARADDYVYFKSGKMTVSYGETVFELTGGACAHFAADNMRGTEHVPSGTFAVCLTAVTPGKLHLKIKY